MELSTKRDLNTFLEPPTPHVHTREDDLAYENGSHPMDEYTVSIRPTSQCITKIFPFNLLTVQGVPLSTYN